MKWRFALCTVLLVSLIAGPLPAQRKPKKDKSQVTPENAADADKKNRDMKVEQYNQKRDYHSKAQDKETRKRMKKNLKRAEKHSWGKDVPWYKRWFRRRRFS